MKIQRVSQDEATTLLTKITKKDLLYSELFWSQIYSKAAVKCMERETDRCNRIETPKVRSPKKWTANSKETLQSCKVGNDLFYKKDEMKLVVLETEP